MRGRLAGFTVIELVVVLVILGIIAAVAIPRMGNSHNFDELTARDQIKQALRHAQQLAMSRTDATVLFTASDSPASINVTLNGVSTPSGSGANFPLILKNISINNVSISFDRLGAPDTAKQLTLTGKARTLAICVEAISGYAHDC